MNSRPTTPDMEAARPLLDQSPASIPPFLLDEKLTESLAEEFPAEPIHVQSLPTWTYAKKQKSGNKLPQAISHRGYKALYPENSMVAFKSAVAAGAHALETDIHLTEDDVVVLSHDATMKRCFGVDKKIIDCKWDYIRRHHTLKAPHQSIPRLRDLLEYLTKPGQEHIWLLLDIKVDNDAEKVMRLIASTIDSVRPTKDHPWSKRIVLGCWAAKYLPYCTKYLPEFPITHIGFSIPYARQFLSVPNVSFNLHQRALMCPKVGPSFIRECKAKGRPVYAWTVNDEDVMRWCIGKGLDGVITDDPKRFLEVCEDWEHGKRGIDITPSEWASISWHNFVVLLFTMIIWWKFGKVAREHADEERPRIALPITSR